MKKYLCPLVCILACLLSSCSLNKDTATREFDGREIIDFGKYYRIYKGDVTQVCYDIYDSEGKIVLSEETDRPVEINILGDNIVDIEIGMGTGIATHRYYHVKKNVFSQEFQNVLSNVDNLIAYIDIPKENPLKNRKVIVQNIFDRGLFFKEFQLDFSKLDTPVIDAMFSKDGTSLQLTYFSGEEQTQTCTILSLI